MANYLYNGYEFPELPSWDKEAYPVAVIVHAFPVSNMQTIYGGEYALMIGKSINSNSRPLLMNIYNKYVPQDGAWVSKNNNYSQLDIYYADFVEPVWTNTNIPGQFNTGIILYASEPIPKHYTVTYNKGSHGSGSNTSDTKTYGIALTLKGAIFTRTGYTQTGWSTVDGGPKVYDLKGTYTANAAITLYPYWTLDTYTITYKKGSYGTGADATDTKSYNTPLILRGAIFTRAGYIQTGWSTEDGGPKVYDLKGTYTANAVITLYPVWKETRRRIFIRYLLAGLASRGVLYGGEQREGA